MSKKFGLGKGLGALIPETEDEIKESNNLFIALNKIKNNVEQPRKAFDNEKIAELAESIKTHGIIQPLLVKKSNSDEYIIVAGERRWRAAKMIGLKEVPVIVMDIAEKEILEVSLIENIQRQDLNPIEEALSYKKLLTEFNVTQEELSKRIGKSRTTITNTMRLVNLDKRVQQYLIEGVLSEGHGRAILGTSNLDKQYEIAQKAIDENLSVREIERLIKSLNEQNNKKTRTSKLKKEDNPYYREIKEKLQEHLGTKVNFTTNKNKGKIEIEYYSEEDLQRILDIMNIE